MDTRERVIDWDDIINRVTEKMDSKFMAHNNSSGQPIDPRPVPPSRQKFFAKSIVERCVKHLREPSSEWNWIACHLSDEMLVAAILRLINQKDNIQRQFRVIDKSGLSYDASLIPEELLSLSGKQIQLCSPVTYWHKLHERIVNPEYQIYQIQDIAAKNYAQSLSCFQMLNQRVYNHLNKEMAYIRTSQNSINPTVMRVDQYVNFSYILIGEALFFCMYKTPLRYNRRLNPFLCQLQKEMKIIRTHHDEKLRSADRFLEVNYRGDRISPVFLVFQAMLTTKQKWEQEHLIEETLEKEADDCASGKRGNIFDNRPTIKHAQYSEASPRPEMIQDITGKEHGSTDDYTKLDEARKFVKRWSEEEGSFGHDDSTGLLQIVYKELFTSKSKLPGKNGTTALSIARRYLNGEKLSYAEKMFLEKKIARGRFVIFDYVREYELYNAFLQLYRNALLEVYGLNNRKLAYEVIFEMNELLLIGLEYWASVYTPDE